MRLAHGAMLFTLLGTSSLSQTSSPASATSVAPANAAIPSNTPKPAATAPANAQPFLPSAILQPSLDGLAQTMTLIKPEKWKGGTVRAEAIANIASIQKDLQGPLPKLIATADQSTSMMSKLLPVVRNLDALYDVLLRVVDGARVVAPGDQVDQLQQAMANLEKARLSINDQLLTMATAQEKQITDLHLSLAKVQVPVPCPAVTAPPAPTPAAKKKVVKKKPVTPAKPATPVTATPQAAAQPPKSN